MDSDESRPGSSSSNTSDSSNSKISDCHSPTFENGKPSSFRKSFSRSQSKSPESEKSDKARSSSTVSSHNDSQNSNVRSPNRDTRTRSRSQSIDEKSLRSITPEEDESRPESKNANQKLSSPDTYLQKNVNGSTNSEVQPRSPDVKQMASCSNSPNSIVSSVSENLKPEEISDSEIESDKGEEEEEEEEEEEGIFDNKIINEKELNESPKGSSIMRHEDLSDVSDSDSVQSNENKSEEIEIVQNHKIVDLRQKLDARKKDIEEKQQTKYDRQDIIQIDTGDAIEKSLLEKKNDEDVLDFEAEEGECNDGTKEEKLETKEEDDKKRESDGETDDGEELEEGEVTDGDEKRPEETEPKPVCRFYTRGQCTWGMSCRFLHPGVTDKGNYTMFDMVRPVASSHGGFGPSSFHDYRNERASLHHGQPPHHSGFPVGVGVGVGVGVSVGVGVGIVAPLPHSRPIVPVDNVSSESAWERGLRTAKEMMRKANKRKEQDMDFEDKKMNLSLSQDELERDNYYAREKISPEVSSPYSRFPPDIEPAQFSPPAKFARGPPVYEEDQFGRLSRFRELPAHRMPHYEDERRVRPVREVIVQRVEPVVRGDEWNDPWMRSKSPGRENRSRREHRSYSSKSSYSSSSTSRSSSSSDSTRTSSPSQRRKYNSHSVETNRRSSPVRKMVKDRSLSPKRRYSPVVNRSPPIKKTDKKISPIAIVNDKRIAVDRSMNPISIKRKKIISPPMMRRLPQSVSQTSDKSRNRRHRSSSSASGSSDTTGSESGTSGSSSSDSSHSRDKSPIKNKRSKDKSYGTKKPLRNVELTKKRFQVHSDAKSESIAAVNSSPTGMNTSKKPTRREELLKQLRAVEDAIARKRSKLN